MSAADGAAAAPLGTVLLVDDDPPMLDALSQVIRDLGYGVIDCPDAHSARTRALASSNDIDILLTDLKLPGEDGITLLASLHDACPLVVGIVITGHIDTPNAVRSLRAGAFDFVAKPVAAAELEVALERAMLHRKALLDGDRSRTALMDMAEARGIELARALKHLEAAYQFMLESLVSMLESRERMAGEHTRRVTEISLVLARRMGVAGAALETIRRGAYLHDIGKVAIPDAILHKPGPLDPEEWRIMKTHVDAGYDILKSNPYLKDVAELVRSHHEHFNGAGYPRGLKGENICLGARIFAVADAYDAIRAARPYSAAQPEEEAVRRITEASGSQFDPEVVAALLACRTEVDQVWNTASTGSAGTCQPAIPEGKP